MQGESSQLSAGTGVLGVCRECITGCTGAVGQVCSSAGHAVLVEQCAPEANARSFCLFCCQFLDTVSTKICFRQ